MIKVTVMYPNSEGGTFNMDYYCKKHIAMVQRLLGKALKGVAVEQGIGGMEPGSCPAFLAIGQLLFDSVDAFRSSFAPHAQEIVGDIPNYTNSRPTIQISDVKL
ncbi:MAG TPA: EthD family reductase [Terriglobales bacterium]|nr:EthD family reductase [Terriglobales bacterium]